MTEPKTRTIRERKRQQQIDRSYAKHMAERHNSLPDGTVPLCVPDIPQASLYKLHSGREVAIDGSPQMLRSVITYLATAEAVARLGRQRPHLSDVYQLRYELDRPPPEIAALLAVSEATVYRRMQQARSLIRVWSMRNAEDTP